MRREQVKLETALRRAGEQLVLRVKAQRTLRAATNSDLGDLIRRVPFATLVADDRQRYVEANTRALRLVGYPRAQLTKLHVTDVVAGADFSLARKRWRGFTTAGAQEGEIALRRRDDSIVVVSYWAYADLLPGRHVSILSESIGTIDEVRPRVRTRSSR